MPHSTLLDRTPWLPCKVIAFLEDFLTKEKTAFEWGSGGSTLFLAERAKKVISVEHNKGWAVNVRDAIKDSGLDNIRYLLKTPTKEEVSYKREFLSMGSRAMGGNFTKYVTALKTKQDAIIVDGRSRICCLYRAKQYLKKGGIVILDNADRGRYNLAIRYMDTLGWKKTEFVGLTPYAAGAITTSFCWQAP